MLPVCIGGSRCVNPLLSMVEHMAVTNWLQELIVLLKSE